MTFRHIVVATDESEAGRQAVRSAIELATHASVRITVMRALPAPAPHRFAGVAGCDDAATGDPEPVALERLRRWLDCDVIPPSDATSIELKVVFGVPGIEICRLAERLRADLLVLGRKERSRTVRLLLGDTADAVVRRSRIPCLLVPPGVGPLRRVIVAFDRSARGISVLRTAGAFARLAGARLRVVTVEEGAVECDTGLEAEVRAVLAREPGASKGVELEVRHGPIVEQILAAAEDRDANVLALGYHRGGPSGIIEAGSIGRHLVHRAPCGVLTVPL